MKIRTEGLFALALGLAISGCSANLARNPSTIELRGTQWRLVSFESMDDALGTVEPRDGQIYSMRLEEDGSVNMHINCNRATGRWSAKPVEQGDNGSFSFGPLASTRALCPQPSLDERILSDFADVRSYLLKDGKLHLSLMADGGVYTWERVMPTSSAVQLPRSPEDGGPRNWRVAVQGGNAKLHEQPRGDSKVWSLEFQSG